MGLMKLNRFLLRFFFQLISTSGSVQKCLWWVVGCGVGFLNIAFTHGSDFVKVKAKFGLVGD